MRLSGFNLVVVGFVIVLTREAPVLTRLVWRARTAVEFSVLTMTVLQSGAGMGSRLTGAAVICLILFLMWALDYVCGKP